MSFDRTFSADSATNLWLASASPRRQELLRQIAVHFQTLEHDVDETRLEDEAPRDFVLRMAREKALSAQRLLMARKFPVAENLVEYTQISGTTKTASDKNISVINNTYSEFETTGSSLEQSRDVVPVILGADTIVVCEEQVLGKPADREDAVRMLSMLSAREHRVFSAVAIVCQQRIEAALSETVVVFRAIDPAQIANYWETGEPRGKAGAYAIQGLGGVLVEHINGSYTGVVGLPLFETSLLLQRFGVPCWQYPTTNLDQE